MNHRRIAIVFLIIILIIMPYYKSLKECIENPDYDKEVVNKTQYSQLLSDYILLLKDTNQALVNSTNNDYRSNFQNLFNYQPRTNT